MQGFIERVGANLAFHSILMHDIFINQFFILKEESSGILWI